MGFLHVESRSLGLCLLAILSRALVLTDTATPHAGRDVGASRSRLSLEHSVDHVTPTKCSVSPFAHPATNAKMPYSTDVAPSATSNKAYRRPPSPIHPIQQQQNNFSHNTTPLVQRRTRPSALLPFCLFHSDPAGDPDRRALQAPCLHVLNVQSAPDNKVEGRPPIMQPKIDRLCVCCVW